MGPSMSYAYTRNKDREYDAPEYRGCSVMDCKGREAGAYPIQTPMVPSVAKKNVFTKRTAKTMISFPIFLAPALHLS